MKSHPVPSTSIVDSPRCLFRTQNGQRRMLAVDFSATLCLYHARQVMPQVPDTVDLLQSLTQPPARFHNPQSITDALAALFSLVTQGRISPRRATALAYIANLLLHNLPAADNREAKCSGQSSDWSAANNNGDSADQSPASLPKCGGQSSGWPVNNNNNNLVDQSPMPVAPKPNTNSSATNAARSSAPIPKSQLLPDTVEGFLAAVRNQIDTTRNQRNTVNRENELSPGMLSD